MPGLFTLDINALLYFSIAAVVGVQITFFGLFALALARKLKLRIDHGIPDVLLRLASLEAAIAVGALVAIAGLGRRALRDLAMGRGVIWGARAK